MVFPEVEIAPGESVYKADEKVEQAFEAAGLELLALDGLNSFLDGAHFFQVPLESGHGVVVVTTKPWEERSLIEVLNVLLSLRMDPDPPGSAVPFRFYSAHPVPAVLRSVFGPSAYCHFECRALLVARFGNELEPGLCIQMAALASFLSRDLFRQRIGFYGRSGVQDVGTLLDSFAADPECEEPINSLLVLGCLFGELIRSRVSLESAWGMPAEDAKAGSRWPALWFSPAAATDGPDSDGPDPDGPDSDGGKAPIGFNAIGEVVQAYQSASAGGAAAITLPQVCSAILRRCEQAGAIVARSDSDGAV